MFKKFCLAGALVAVSLLANIKPVLADDCGGEVSIARMNWASAELVAEIDKVVLSAGFGCTVEFSTGDALPLLESIRLTGKPDLIPELWEDSVSEALASALRQETIDIAVEVLSDGGEEGFWIPKYIADAHPDIKTLQDALARPDLFVHTEEDSDESASVFYNCPADWECHIATINLFRAFGAQSKGFTLINSGSAAGLDASIAKAHEEEAGWLGYYWAPTALLGRYEMIKLEMGEHDEAQWRDCILVLDCENPAVNAWPTRSVLSVVSKTFSDQSDTVMDYLSLRQWDNQTVNGLLAWMAENQATGEEAAWHFLEHDEDIWSAWVPAGVRDRIKAAL